MEIAAMHNPSRRILLRTAGAFSILALGGQSVAIAQGNPDARGRKFVFVVLRGAMDGLSAVPPLSDPDYATLRGPLAMRVSGEGAALPWLRGFGVHPALQRMHASGKLVVAHAVASPYRNRSHFDAQAMLELGGSRTSGPDGWLNRALTASGSTAPVAMAVGGFVPLVLTGRSRVMNWLPAGPRGAGLEDVHAGMARLYAAHPEMLATFREGLRGRGLTEAALEGRRVGQGFEEACRALGDLMRRPGGPTVAVTELGGWDTHVGQGNERGRLATALGQLDGGIEALRVALGADEWARTVVCAATEFGRTARPNGTNGTDHGTGGVAFLTGGAIKENRLVADWPGLSDQALYENRDLAPTGDVRALFKAVLAEHMRMPSAVVNAAFPDAVALRPFTGLFA